MTGAILKDFPAFLSYRCASIDLQLFRGRPMIRLCCGGALQFRHLRFAMLVLLLAGGASQVEAQPDPPKDAKKPLPLPTQLASLGLRSIGPALTSGRVIAFAVNPTDST